MKRGYTLPMLSGFRVRIPGIPEPATDRKTERRAWGDDTVPFRRRGCWYAPRTSRDARRAFYASNVFFSEKYGEPRREPALPTLRAYGLTVYSNRHDRSVVGGSEKNRRYRNRAPPCGRFVPCGSAPRKRQGHAEPPHSVARARERSAMSKSKRTRGTTSRRRDADAAMASLEGPDEGVRTRSGAVVAPPETSHGRVSGRTPSPAPGASHPSPPATVEADEKRTWSPSSPGPAAEAAVAASPLATHAAPSSCGTTKRVDQRSGENSRSPETDASPASAPASPTHQTLARDAPAFDGSSKTRTVRFSRHVHGTPRRARRHAEGVTRTSHPRKDPRNRARTPDAVDTDAPTHSVKY